ncbi:MAG: hypothetical protein ABIB71_01000 [Candidatus Woesearchaeota archaeon]
MAAKTQKKQLLRLPTILQRVGNGGCSFKEEVSSSKLFAITPWKALKLLDCSLQPTHINATTEKEDIASKGVQYNTIVLDNRKA